MESRRLGETGLFVSRLGLGLAALGRPGYINLGHADDLERDYEVKSMEARAHAVLDAAWHAGIRYFDVARSYGRAEEFLGSWLLRRRAPAESVTVGSKWGYEYTAGWRPDAQTHEVKEHSLQRLRKQIGESRKFIGAHIDLYQIHSATLDSGVLEDPGVLEELGRLRDTGLAIGLTLTGPHQAATLDRARKIAIGGRRLFDCVQATWNLLEPSAGPSLAAAHRSGLGVIVKEALANGRLTVRNRDPAFAAKRRVLEEVAMRLEASVDALALAAALAEPWADVVLSGAATTWQLHSNLASRAVDLVPASRERLAAVAESPNDYWAARSRLAWN